MASAFKQAWFLFCLLFFTGALHADVIYLKNGKKIECESAWQEGKTVKYKISTGTASIPQSMVEKIEKSSSASSESAAKGQAPVGRIDPLTGERLARFYTDRGMELLQSKDFPKALKQFEKAYGYHSSETTTLNLAIAYYYLKDDWNAENHFNEVLRKNPDNAVALNYLAEMHWRKEELDQAEEYWKRSLSAKEDPGIRTKLQRLAKEREAAAHYNSEESNHFLIRYDGGSVDPSFASAVSAFLEEAYQHLSSQYDVFPPDPFVVIFYPQQQFVNVVDVPVWSGGANDGKIKLPIKGLTTVNPELKRLLLHELSHSFVNLKTLGNSPGWLQEGLAKYWEGERTSLQGKTLLRNLLSTRSLPPLRNLSGSFADANTQTASIFYVESLSFVEYLIARYNFLQLNQLLDLLGKQHSLQDAFEAAYQVSPEEMEKLWRADLSFSPS